MSLGNETQAKVKTNKYSLHWFSTQQPFLEASVPLVDQKVSSGGCFQLTPGISSRLWACTCYWWHLQNITCHTLASSPLRFRLLPWTVSLAVLLAVSTLHEYVSLSASSKSFTVRMRTFSFWAIWYFLPALIPFTPFSQVTLEAGWAVSHSKLMAPFSSAVISLSSRMNLFTRSEKHNTD